MRKNGDEIEITNSWRITHSLLDTVDMASQHPGYPAYGISCSYDDNGKLTSIEHELTAEEGINNAEAAIACSRCKLQWLIDLLAYQSGLPVRLGRVQAYSCDVTRSHSKFGSVSTTMSVPAVARVQLPEADKRYTWPDRMETWLHFANWAHKSTSPAHALRDYYVVIEDMKDEQSVNLPEDDVKHVKYARDFVSHPTLTRNRDAVKYVAQGIGEPDVTEVCYDPHKDKHKAFVERHRELAHELVGRQLKKWL